MKKMLETLYVLTPESYLFERNGNICISVGGKEKASVPITQVSSVVIFGKNTLSTALLSFCSQNNVAISFVSENGRFQGRLCGPVSGNVLLRKRQYAALEGLRNCASEVEKMRLSYQQRRNLMSSRFAEIGLPACEPDGAFYYFVDIRSSGLSAEEFATKLINEYNVAVVPGTAFGVGGEGFIRCCYATDINKIKEALNRIEKMMNDLRAGKK